jgi:hypothetical protein
VREIEGQQKHATKMTTNGVEWEWWKAVVPQKLKEVHDSGCVPRSLAQCAF